MNVCKPTLIPSLRTESTLRVVLPLALILVSGVVLAAHKAEEESPKSASLEKPIKDATPLVAIPEYVSPLQSFQNYVESDEPNWKEANDLVGEIGGWRAYAREAYLADRQEREAMKKALEQSEIEQQAVENNSENTDVDSKVDDTKKSEGESE